MSEISKIKLFNFKAFSNETELDLDGNHLLMYGENGSGKSSIYWALYTLMQSSTKSQAEIQKYFTPNNKEHLINYHLVENQSSIDPATGEKIIPQSIGLNSFAEIELQNGSTFKIDSQGLTTNVDVSNLQDLNKFSDFVSHRLLINFYNFRNSKKINLWEVFVRDIFPFVNNQHGNGALTLSQVLKEIETSKPFKLHDDGHFTLSKSTAWQGGYDSKIHFFNEDLSHWIGEINTLVNTFYTKHFQPIHNDNIKISLKYSKKLEFRNGHPQFYSSDNRNYERWYNYVGFNFPEIDLKIETLNADGTYTEMTRPQSYFNEAKLTSIALSVRFSLLDSSIRPPFTGQFLALDDLLVSMDMSNRDKVLDILLDEYASKYKIYLFTHEKSFFDFCTFKIEQRKKKKEWEIMEIHSGETYTDKPVIIPSVCNSYDKALKYFKAKDYTTCSLYLRKELEKLVTERLPEEYTKTIDGQFHNLEHYWKLFIERFQRLGIEITPDIKNYFKQSKLLILNPAAHHNLNLPVYKLELERAFALVKDIYDKYPIPKLDIILCKGMKLKFTHPNENYTFEFELEEDFSTNSINTGSEVINPKCKILSWQFNGNNFWDFNKGRNIPYDVLNKPIIHDLLKIMRTHLGMQYLNLNVEMFLNNTLVLSNVSLKKIFEDYNIQINYNLLGKNHELFLN
jgi:energy-coupling factor transporter ATP-binding protein EcfA2